MKRYESRHNPAVKDISDYIHSEAQDLGIHPDTLDKITRVLDGIEITDRIISEKEQLLVQKERELESLRQITDNSSNVVRNTINESKGNLDKATDLLNSGKFSEALKYSDIALYNIEGIDNLGLQTLAQANNLYLERNQQYVESAGRRDYLYNSSVVNGVNAFSWVKSNPTRDFYTFFREALNIPDKEQQTPDNVRIINRLYELLPLYVEEAQRTNYFYNEYNKYHDTLLKLQQVINIHNIKATASKGLKDYEEALRSCDIVFEIDPQNLTLSNLKNAILQEKQNEEASKLEENNLLVSQIQEIERLKEQLSQKEIETQELLARKELEKKELLDQKELELANKSLVKNQVIGDLQDDIGLKEKESYKLQIELLMKQVEFHKKESELKDKILEAAREIGKQKEINTELLDQNEVLDLKMQYATKEARVREIEKSILFTQKEKLSSLLTQKDYELNNALLQKEIEQKELLIQKEMELADKSLIKNQVIDQLREEIADLNKQLSQNNIAYSIYLDEVGCQPGSSLFEKQLLESLDLSSINLSPIDDGGQNQIAGNVIGNFDINHINTTHSIYPSGEGSSFDIIDVENSH